MPPREIAVGALVEHETFGTGSVEALDESGGVVVRFGNGDPHPMSASVASNLRVLPEDGLKARLKRDPQEAGLWAKDAPLKLVAAALVDIGEADQAALKGRLEDLVVDNTGKKWKSWWNVVKPAFDDSKYFDVKTNTKGAFDTVGLARGVVVYDVPVEPLTEKAKPPKASTKKAPTVKDWQRWLGNESEGPVPGNRPNKGVFKLLSAWRDEATINAVLSRALEGASQWMASGSASAQVATSWSEAVARATIRWRHFNETGSDTYLAALIGTALVKLAQISGNAKDSLQWLHVAGELDKRPSDWHMAFRSGMWEAVRDSTDAGGALINALGFQLGRRGQIGLAEDIALAAFRTDHSPQRDARLDRMLYGLQERDRAHAVNGLVVRAAALEAPKETVAGYVATSRHVDESYHGDAKLRLLVMASLILEDAGNHLAAEASTELADALDASARNGSPVDALLTALRTRDRGLRTSHADEMASLRQEYESKLEAAASEQERLTQLAKSYAARAASTREESKLEVRLGMLTMIAEVLEMWYRPERTAEARLRDVLSALTLALKAGDAEPLGKVGEIMRFDPALHHSKAVIPAGAEVCLCSPGVIVRNKSLGDRLVAKALVTHQSKVGK